MGSTGNTVAVIQCVMELKVIFIDVVIVVFVAGDFVNSMSACHFD